LQDQKPVDYLWNALVRMPEVIVVACMTVRKTTAEILRKDKPDPETCK